MSLIQHNLVAKMQAMVMGEMAALHSMSLWKISKHRWVEEELKQQVSYIPNHTMMMSRS